MLARNQLFLRYVKTTDLAKAQEIANEEDFDIHCRDLFSNLTALMIALKHADEDMLDWLLSKGANVNDRTNNGETPIIIAAELETSRLEKLLGDQADLDAQTKSGETALHRAVEAENSFNVRLLLQKGANVNLRDKFGSTAYDDAVSCFGNVDLLAEFLDNGCHPDTTNNDGKTALHQAAEDGDYSKVKYLLERGVDPNQLDAKLNMPAIYFAAIQYQERVCRLLESYGSLPADSFRPTPLNLIFKPRKLDFQNDKQSSLLKSFHLFSPSFGVVYGGIEGSMGAYAKQKKDPEKTPDTYYLANHHFNAYWAYEIFARLGINTPKTRLIKNPSGKIVAGKCIPDYIPMSLLRDNNDEYFFHDGNDEKNEYHRYTLDYANQRIVDREENTTYKINRNLFGFPIASTIVHDTDPQYDHNNLGLIRIGKRFYTTALDKDTATFKGYDYAFLSTLVSKEPKAMRDTTTIEQTLAIVYQIHTALIPDTDGICDFERIFINPRVAATPDLSTIAKESCENFLKTARSTISYFERYNGAKYLSAFAEREEIRRQIADKMLSSLNLAQENLLNLVIEDLRGVYYRSLFTEQDGLICKEDLNNQDLLDAIESDLREEFELESRNVIRIGR